MLVATAACTQADRSDTAAVTDTVAASVDTTATATADSVADANTVGADRLTGFAHMDSAKAQALIAARPFGTIVDLNKFLLSQGLTQEEATEFYQNAFVKIDLNTGTRDEMLLIPGVGPRMAHELEEYRPWTSWAQFDKEIGKYVDEPEWPASSATSP